jgi:hypothetical protein
MWAYDAGEPYYNKKHGWSHPYAGVKTRRIGRRMQRVSCCPGGITQQMAEQILNVGLPYFEDEPGNTPAGSSPDRIFCVYDGVPYEARPTLRGHSYHAFPILPERFAELPESVRTYLETTAAAQGRPIEKWLRTWKR